MPSIAKRPDGRWRARFRDADGREHAKHFKLKKEANAWLDEVTTSVGTGTYVAPDKAKVTVGDWCDQWLAGHSGRPNTLRLAKSHVRVIKAGFPGVRLKDLRPSMVKAWTVELGKTLAPSTVYALYRRLAQVMAAAHRDGLISRSPCSREVAPKQGAQRPFVATPEQVWQLHEAFPEHLRPAVLLAAFAGLRIAEVAGLRPRDVDLDGAVITPAVQFGGGPLKSDAASTPIPIPTGMADSLRASMERWPGNTVVTNGMGDSASTWMIERAIRAARTQVAGLPDGFRLHDLRHFYASALIGSGLDIKTVQVRVRHSSAMTTLNTYGHLMPDADRLTRSALDPHFDLADKLRTTGALEGGQPGPD